MANDGPRFCPRCGYLGDPPRHGRSCTISHVLRDMLNDGYPYESIAERTGASVVALIARATRLGLRAGRGRGSARPKRRRTVKDTLEVLEATMLDDDEPPPPPSKVRTLEEMSDAEIEALEKQYGCKVRRPSRGGGK